MRNSRLLKWVAVAALAVSGLAAGPANAAVTAAKPAKPAKMQTWIGQVQRDGRHFDYVGQPCPTNSGMLCANYVAHYRIVAQNPAAARALRQVAGGQARLQARFSSSHDRTHQGTLLARSVEAWCGPDGPCPPPAGHTVKVDEAANGSDVSLAPGDHLQITLHSTYWQFTPSSDPSVLAADGGPQTGPGTNCPRYPGSGCGTVTQNYTALKAGKATVSADRTTCGEAMACNPAQHYTLTVHVH
ncbi:MAG: hypothetical protein LC792_20345 [Actinobacteria bacterium]|nr:hypothetical protein [Actinomycetota bacterium]